MATAIEFNHVGKQYRLGLVSTRTLSHDLNRWWQMAVLKKEDPYLTIGETNDRTKVGNSEYVWALRDIDFKVEQGDVVGIIGKNGAGKSTLLKLLSKVTGPTVGTIRARGRIGALLEVGTGFHPEMTGRENIYMNGAIMGMSKAEVTRKLDEIIDFSGCERYIDTPVKRYSSGMMVRLGFAVAAHLEPEILVVDEVLAVGDAEFQKKAIGKMQSVSQGEGRTVLFVSHNMVSIKRLCKTGVLLDNGRVALMGNIDTVISQYKASCSSLEYGAELSARTDRTGNGALRVVDSYILNDGEKDNKTQIGDAFKLVVELKRFSSMFRNGSVGVAANICNMDEVKLLQFSTRFVEQRLTIVDDITAVQFELKRFPLAAGKYYVRFYVDDGIEVLDWIDHAFSFTVEDGDFYRKGEVENSALLYTDFSVSLL